MATGRSFAEFVKDKCYNGLYQVAEEFVNINWESLNLYTKKVHRMGAVEMIDATIQRVYVRDLPGMRVAFEVGLELEIDVKEGDYHYDESNQCYPWIRIYCEGDLSCGLDDWEIKRIEPYSQKNAPANSLSDALVPYIPYDQLDKVATEFLKEYYPAALKVTPYGQPPVGVDPLALADSLGLTVKQQRIREDASIFGQIYFVETDAEMYDANEGKTVSMTIPDKTIIFDPQMYLLRNLGSVNNTIIQMPAEPFKVKAKEYIARFMRESNASHENEVMEQVITALETAFGVSKQAAKIRLVELGFDAAIGTYTYLDGHYVKPHTFRKGALKVNQTFSISAQDAAVERFVNQDLRKLTESGDYLFIDNHYVYNAPLYVQYDEDGRLGLTDYARSHMDECCLVFDMKITSKVGEEYHTACFLNREDSNITFELNFHNGYQNAPQERQVAMRKKQQEEDLAIRKQMTDDPEQCMDLLLKWRGMKYMDLGDAIDRDPKTISRTVKGETTPKVETAALICFGMHLPPCISFKLMEVLRCPLSPVNPAHQWISEALYIKYPEPIWAVREYLAPYGVEI